MPKMGQEYEFTNEQLRAFQDLFLKARENVGKSQVAVAEETGLKQTWISTIERATYPSFNLLDVLKLAHYYGISPNSISSALGFVEDSPEAAQEDESVAIQFKRLFQRLPPDQRQLATTIVRNVLINMADFYDKK